MRQVAKVDANQKAIVKALRAIGCTVYYIKEPVDLLVGFRGRSFALEIKNPEVLWKLTPQQVEFFRDFTGEAYIVEDDGQALRAAMGRLKTGRQK